MKRYASVTHASYPPLEYPTKYAWVIFRAPDINYNGKDDPLRDSKTPTLLYVPIYQTIDEKIEEARGRKGSDLFRAVNEVAGGLHEWKRGSSYETSCEGGQYEYM